MQDLVCFRSSWQGEVSLLTVTRPQLDGRGGDGWTGEEEMAGWARRWSLRVEQDAVGLLQGKLGLAGSDNFMSF